MFQVTSTRRSLRLLCALSLISCTIAPGIVAPAPVQASLQEAFERVWSSVFRNAAPRPRRGVSRGDGEFCAISPFPTSSSDVSDSTATIVPVAGDRPTFVWRGTAELFEVRSLGGELLWKPNLSGLNPDEPIHQLTYAGPPLQPGQTYTWVIKRTLFAALSNEFQVLSLEEQQQIRSSLQTLEQEQQAIGSSADEIAVQRANYFAGEQLWSDFWAEVLAIDPSTPELETVIQQTIVTLCDTQE